MNLSTLANRLQTTSARLDGLFNERERTFLAIGQSLGGAIAEIRRITEAFEALPALLENDALRQATERISTISRTTESIRSAVAGEDDALTELLALNREIGERLTRLQSSVRTIGVLTSNAKIEAARVQQSGNDFANFTVEIGRLAQRAQDTVDSYLNEHKRLVVLLTNVRKVQTQFFQKYHGTLLSISDELDATLAIVEGRQRKAAASAATIAVRSKRINEAIGMAVMSLQISDITRQRIEHMCFALDHLRGGLEAAPNNADQNFWSQSLTETESKAVVFAVCRLQSAQLADALNEYDETVSKIHMSLPQLVDECRRVAHEGGDVYGAAGRDSESFLDALKNKLALGLNLIHDCQIAGSAATHATAVVATTVRELQQKVSSVNQIVFDMTLVGMNAAFKSRQLGTVGLGLGIIADELRIYAQQTTADANALKPALANVISAAERFEVMRLGEDGETLDLKGEMATAMNGFDQCASKLKEALIALSGGAKHVGQILQHSAAQIDGQKDAPDALLHARLELDQLTDGESRAVAKTDVMAAMMDRLSARYSMVRERLVHQRFAASMNGLGADTPPQEHALGILPAEESGMLDDILFANG
ncbi:MAG: hypothetical protein ACLP8A_04470 [Methylovirgula sp.]